ncbi:MAG TPA: SagB/ThcOx family dehydrogenase [Methanotrichaceae archaeon]|nr:SagB/ThcOx family dehydrogenase [Methanotrichaceae archaeon]
MRKSGIIIIIGLAVLSMAVMTASNGLKEDASKAIKLPEPRTDGNFSVEKALDERRSIRTFGNQSLTLDEVSQLLWACQGVTDDKGHRTAPSALGIYPLQVYLLAGNVTGLPTGVYQYSPQGHNLTVVAQGNIDEYYNASAGFEGWIKTAPAIFVITGDFNRTSQMPGRDLSPWVYIDAGAAAENLLLEVVSIDLAATYTAGFNANKTKELLGLAPGEETIGVLPVGRKA